MTQHCRQTGQTGPDKTEDQTDGWKDGQTDRDPSNPSVRSSIHARMQETLSRFKGLAFGPVACGLASPLPGTRKNLFELSFSA